MEITNSTKCPSLGLSLIPIIVMVILLFFTIHIFGSDALSGGSQVVLLLTTACCSALAMYNPQNEMFRLLGTKRSFSQNETFFFRTPKHPLPCPFPLNFSLLIITKKFGNLAKNRYICIV